MRDKLDFKSLNRYSINISAVNLFTTFEKVQNHQTKIIICIDLLFG